jgi:hypothetical protein
MTRLAMWHQFGRRPSLEAVLLYAVQQALKGYGKTHPDSKRTHRAKLEARARKQRSHQ